MTILHQNSKIDTTNLDQSCFAFVVRHYDINGANLSTIDSRTMSHIKAVLPDVYNEAIDAITCDYLDC